AGVGREKVATEVHIIGYRKGWFLVEVGPYDDAEAQPRKSKPFIGRGWVSGNMVTTELLRNMLKQSANPASADVIHLEVNYISSPENVGVKRILACSGDWLHVELALKPGMKPLLASDAPAGMVRGWSNGTCTNQLTTCDFSQDTPWSPP